MARRRAGVPLTVSHRSLPSRPWDVVVVGLLLVFFGATAYVSLAWLLGPIPGAGPLLVQRFAAIVGVLLSGTVLVLSCVWLARRCLGRAEQPDRGLYVGIRIVERNSAGSPQQGLLNAKRGIPRGIFHPA